MGLSSLFKFGGKYFDKNIQPKCDYCQFGKRAKDGDKVLCEKRGLVDASFSCGKFTYSPLKRIPVKQLKFVGSLADDEIYVETKDDKAEKEAAEAEAKGIKTPDKPPYVFAGKYTIFIHSFCRFGTYSINFLYIKAINYFFIILWRNNH